MRRFNFMLNGSRLMMFPFYVCILVCVALLMVKFAMQLYVLCRDIIDIHYLDLITGVLTLVDFVLVAQMLTPLGSSSSRLLVICCSTVY